MKYLEAAITVAIAAAAGVSATPAPPSGFPPGFGGPRSGGRTPWGPLDIMPWSEEDRA
jgi:hypothetical protein